MQRSLMASLNIHFYAVNHPYNIHELEFQGPTGPSVLAPAGSRGAL